MSPLLLPEHDFAKGHKRANEAFLKNVNGAAAGSRFLRKSRVRFYHRQIFGPKGGSRQQEAAL